MNGEASKYPHRQYVWALGHGTNRIPIGDRIDDRYRVVAPSIWVDTQPETPPKVPDPVPDFALPYLKAYPYQLHLPGVYGICHQVSGEAVLLLSNVPVDAQGQLMPAITKAWAEASEFYQAYWLWQMLDLWEPTQGFGAAASLLKTSNIRVEGWRVRLIGLSTNPSNPTLTDLAEVWEASYSKGAKGAIAPLLKTVCADLRSSQADLAAIKEAINQQLLQAAARSSLTLQVAGATSPGPQKVRNEDACYPSLSELKCTHTADLPLLPRLAIVCDGVGGHEGGEVASQTVVRSLQLQLRSLLAEAMDQSKTLAPPVVIEQIEAAIRVANNLVAQQNDEQGRTHRQRMGTTLVMALVLPQRVETPEGPAEVNELYLTHIGDSRAYWITPQYCQQLTVDDDLAGREISAGQAFYATAIRRREADALTQAVGLRPSEQLHPHTQRFLFEGSGVLLLCSDGLSDNGQVEASWANYVGLIVNKIVPLDAAVESWIELANQKNGHDNVAVVLMSVEMASAAEDSEIPLAQPGKAYTSTHTPVRTAMGQNAVAVVGASNAHRSGPATIPAPPHTVTGELTPASRALLYGESDEDDMPLSGEDISGVFAEETTGAGKSQRLITTLLALLVLGVVGLVSWLLWRTLEGSAPLETPPPAQESPQEFPAVPEPASPPTASPANPEPEALTAPTTAPPTAPTAPPTAPPPSQTSSETSPETGPEASPETSPETGPNSNSQ